MICLVGYLMSPHEALTPDPMDGRLQGPNGKNHVLQGAFGVAHSPDV